MAVAWILGLQTTTGSKYSHLWDNGKDGKLNIWRGSSLVRDNPSDWLRVWRLSYGSGRLSYQNKNRTKQDKTHKPYACSTKSPPTEHTC